MTATRSAEVRPSRFAELPLEQVLDAIAAASACTAVMLSAGNGAFRSLGAAVAATAFGLGLRVVVGELEGGGAREDPRTSLAARLSPFYAFLLAAVVVFFPDPAGPRLFELLVVCEVPLLAFAALPRVRVVADVNAGLMVAGANAAGGDGVGALTALFLAGYLARVAIENAGERAGAAGADPRTGALERVGLASGLGAAALAIAVYVGALYAVPAPPPPPKRDAAAKPDVPDLGGKRLILPWRAFGSLAGFVAASAGLVYVWHLWMKRRPRGPLARSEGESALELGPIEALEPAPEEPAVAAGSSERARVVVEYQRFAREAASRNLGRAPSEGASEHAGALAYRFPGAAGELAEVAGRFARARYGAEEPEARAADAVRDKAERALEKIDGAVRARDGRS